MMGSVPERIWGFARREPLVNSVALAALLFAAFAIPACLVVTIAAAAAQFGPAEGIAGDPADPRSPKAGIVAAGGWRRLAVDLNGDGFADVLYHTVGTRGRISDQPDGSARFRYSNDGIRYRIYESNGDGTFIAHPQRVSVSKGHFCRNWDDRPGWGSDCSLVDVDGDGDSDLVIISRGQGAGGLNRVRVLYSVGGGVFETGPERALPDIVKAGNGWHWRWAELTGDGKADILNIYGGDRYALGEDRDGNPRYRYSNDGLAYRVFASKGDGTFAVQPPATALPSGNYCMAGQGWPGIGSRCSLADIDGDGMSDLAILSEARAGATGMNRYRALLSTGEGTFETGREYMLPAEIRVGKGWRWRWAELNGDGRADILNYYGGSRYKLDENRDGRPRYRNTNDGFRLQVFLSRADGTFAHRPPASLIGTGNHCTGFLGWHCDLADINGDGVTDIVRTNLNDGIQTQVFVGDRSGMFSVGPLTRTAPAGLSPGGGGTSALADVNGDGNADIVAFRQGRQSEMPFQVLLSNGDGTFTAIERGSAFGPAN